VLVWVTIAASITFLALVYDVQEAKGAKLVAASLGAAGPALAASFARSVSRDLSPRYLAPALAATSRAALVASPVTTARDVATPRDVAAAAWEVTTSR